jgi:hypothetical protein
MALDGIIFVKVQIITPKHQKLNSKLNASYLKVVNTLNIIILELEVSKRDHHNVLSFS